MSISNHRNNIISLKKRIKALESIIEKEPVLFMSNSGKIWISDKARNKLSEKKIDTNDLLEWLGIGVKHLTEASYADIGIFMVQLPGNPRGSDILIILGDEKKERVHSLTAKEKKVLRYLVRGLSNKGIASNLNIRAGTVNAHLDNIYRKLQVSNRVEAICSAIKLGIVVPAP
jgi:DNA-binding NarL/FixJ family response regulator